VSQRDSPNRQVLIAVATAIAPMLDDIQGALPDATNLPDYLSMILGRFEGLAAVQG